MKQRRFLIHIDAVQTYQRKSAEKVQHMTSERRLAFAAAVSVLRGTVGLYAVRLMGHFVAESRHNWGRRGCSAQGKN